MAMSLVNSCTGETILLDGFVHVFTSVTANQTGTRTADWIFDFHGVSMTNLLTGVKYVSGDDIRGTASNLGPGSRTDVFMREIFVRSGESTTFVGGDDVYFHLNAHLTVNANDVLTATVDNMNASCN
jgi:hypothetical protein